jgi:hypothetical protein
MNEQTDIYVRVPNTVVEWIAFLLRILKVLYWNLGLEISYANRTIFMIFTNHSREIWGSTSNKAMATSYHIVSNSSVVWDTYSVIKKTINKLIMLKKNGNMYTLLLRNPEDSLWYLERCKNPTHKTHGEMSSPSSSGWQQIQQLIKTLYLIHVQ